jgi:hypothetical protein
MKKRFSNKISLSEKLSGIAKKEFGNKSDTEIKDLKMNEKFIVVQYIVQ